MTLELNNVSTGYGKRQILHNITLSVIKSEIVALIGANGCGKSTLLKVISNSLSMWSGNVAWNNQSLRQIGRRNWAKICALLPQEHSFPASLTVDEFVSYGRFPHRRFGSGFDHLDQLACEDAIAQTELTAFRHKQLNRLSGGERQRAWIAMSLARQPQLLLLDEPTTFLDIHCQSQVFSLLKQLSQKSSLTIIMVLHDVNMAVRLASRIIALKNGCVLCTGTAQEIMNPQTLFDIYNIHAHIEIAADKLPYCLPKAFTSLPEEKGLEF